jgi:acylpyruvate hydrolase
MRLVTLRTAGGTRAGRVDGDEVIELAYPDVAAALAADPDLTGLDDSQGAARHQLAEADLAPLVPHPSKVFCLGLNYASHIEEMGHDAPSHPTLFGKFPRALIGARDDIVLPAVSERVDWEVELCLVIGRPVRHAQGAEAAAAIAGYTVANDVSMRDWQRRTSQFLQGKTFERSTPVGPALVTLDELPGGGADLELRCEVDGQLMQRGRTSDLLFDPAEIVAYISQIVTLEPGDLILTGTPSGVGDGRTPPVYLQPGQVVRTVIEGVGELVNTCVAEKAPAGS